MTQPRDIDLQNWLDRIAFHPANDERKQLGHELARSLVANMGVMLYGLLPAGQDKSLAFTHLKEVLMWANSALAVGGGPAEDIGLNDLKTLLANDPMADPRQLADLGVTWRTDPRIEQYKAEQRGETAQFDAGERHEDSFTAEVAGQRPLPDDFTVASDDEGHYDATVATDDPEVTVNVNSSVDSQRVQIGVTSTRERVQACLDEQAAGGPAFTGFYAGFTTSDALSAFLAETASAGEVAFGQRP